MKQRRTYNPEFERYWALWKDIEGYIGKEPDNAMSIFGVNTYYNSEFIKIYEMAIQAPTRELTRAILEYEAKGLIYDKYYVASKKVMEELRPIHFFFQNAWSCPYSRKQDLVFLSYMIRWDPVWLSLECANERIKSKSVLRRIEKVNNEFKVPIL